MSLRKFKKIIARRLGVTKEEVGNFGDVVKDLVKEHFAPKMQQQTPQQQMAALLEELGEEGENGSQLVYLVTISRVLPDTIAATDLVDVTKMSSEQMLHLII